MASFFEHIGSEVESVADAAALASKIAAEAAQVAAEASANAAASSASDASNSEATVTASQNAAAASATSSASSAATSTTKASESASSSATSSTKAAESAASAATATTKASEASASAATATTKAAEATSARNDIIGLTASTGAAGSSASYNSSTGVLSVPRGDTGAQGIQGIQGPAGQDSTVAGPQGPAGQDSTVAGPQGPAGQDSTVAGPQGNQGIQGVQGPAGSDGTQFDTNVLKVDGTNNRVGINDTTPSVSLDAGSNTDAIAVPVGTTAQRPADGAGRFRYNSTTQAFEGYTTEWGSIAGGGGTNTFSTDSFTANGSTTAYALSQVVSSEGSLLVFIDGVFQTQDAYSIATASGATTLTFSAAPANNRKIVVYSVAAAVSGSNLNIDSMTGDGSDVTLTLSIAPVNVNNTIVTIDGVYQAKANYSISGTTLTFSTAPPSGSAVEVMTFTQTDINVPVDGTVTPAKIASGDFYFDTNTLYVDATNNRVGISTSNPQKTLDVQGEIAISNSANSYWNLNRDDSTGALTISDTGTQRFAITPAGSVGIGVSALNNPLEVGVTPNTTSKTSGSAFDGSAIRLNGNLATTNSEVAIIGGLDNGIQAGIGFVRESISTWGSAIKFYTRQASVVDLDGVAERLRISSDGTLISSKSSGIFFKNSSGGTNSTQIMVSNSGGSMRAGVESSSGGAIQTGTSAYAAVFGNQGNYPTQFTTNGSTKMTINADGIVVHNGVSTYSNSVSMMNNVAYSFDIPVGNEGGAGNVIEVHAMYDHYYNFAYGASLITLVGKRGVSVSRSDIKVITTTNGGAWSVSAPNATTLRVTKSAGTYPGPAFGHIMVRFRKS